MPEFDRPQARLLWAEFELPNPSSYPLPSSFIATMGRVLLKVCHIIFHHLQLGLLVSGHYSG